MISTNVFVSSLRFVSCSLVVSTISIIVILPAIAKAATGQPVHVVCPKGSIQACLKTIEKAYAINVKSNVDFGNKTIELSMDQENPLNALQQLIGVTGVENFVIEYNKTENNYTITIPEQSLDKSLEVESQNERGASPSPADELKSKNQFSLVPTPEFISEVLEIRKKVQPVNLDAPINIPGVNNSSNVTPRQIQSTLDKQLVSSPNLDAPAMPGLTGDNAMTVRQIKDKQTAANSSTEKRTAASMPDNTPLDVEKIRKASQQQPASLAFPNKWPQ